MTAYDKAKSKVLATVVFPLTGRRYRLKKPDGFTHVWIYGMMGGRGYFFHREDVRFLNTRVTLRCWSAKVRRGEIKLL